MTIYRPELCDAICARLAEGETLVSICRDEGMPSRPTVYRWLEEKPGFREQFDRAVEFGCHALLDQTIEIADNSPMVELQSKLSTILETLGDEGDDGVPKRMDAIRGLERTFNDIVQERKLRIWTRHELMARKRPDLFGKQRIEHSNDPANPLPAPQFIIQPVAPAPAAIADDDET